MSYSGAELQALQSRLFPNSASGIARALPSFMLYIFKFPVSRSRPLVSLSDNLNPFQRWRGGKHKLCTYGAGMAKSRWAGTPSYAKTTDLSGSIFCSPVPEKKPTQYSLLQQLPRKTVDRWYCHGHSQVSSSLAAHLEVRPPLSVAPHHDFWPSRVNVWPQPSTNTQWQSTVWFFKQIQANFEGECYCLIENRFL